MVVNTMDKDQPKVVLGWREWVSLPDLGIEHIKAKVDTGARSSALHTFELSSFSEDGIARVRFAIHPLQNDTSTIRYCVADLLDERYVSDSGGHRELRPVICTTLRIGSELRKIEMTLANRETMKFRMLLGRTAMSGLCMVDTGASFLLGRPVPGAHVVNQFNKEDQV
ncbi:MAG: ATP-dependent zinc protease [Zetaproteobacteria bacterium CG06_land_8_20_14_3_00_59_53]|nr:MAG: ribosomal protein S6 modification protein [Zetaproteobacteria bacterium CG2_30_59_37]PIO90691.1 MAG: ATP-dependent zinc protease [Zetaproteobacteria bacterium CG23_combo_of_CG06-09_8_20_14_all_59_86]PIQ66046.1 MAG: ATP-dependent zinc protease [Zetaproteobacteria bacterium CG11_big_fil_rev_8_21_14_0_20_59_439]PIU69986.1 MAG: ATP-dependent zinc protease [Zetaproteobacteria bacterium CG06_land_8_20_14_3_00_59_53]PIU97898.1 MAG: ATP-dependent zinc protease [Zetaproteobacteria bacterium CG03